MIYNNVMCKKSVYKIKLETGNYSKDSYPVEKLYKQFDINSIRELILKKKIVIIPCGKCEDCIQNKRYCYHNRVNSQMKLSKYSYLITLTFTNEKIFTLLNYEDKDYLLNNQKNRSEYSPFTNLSKYDIEKIIKNWKNKFNRYYNCKVHLHYFLCGEYGSNTHRAHYHILLMSDYPIPYMIKQSASGNHYQSKLIASKQFDIYDIQPCNGSKNTSNYITKYLQKASTNNLSNYNRFEEKQIRYLLDHDKDIHNYLIWDNVDHMREDLLLFILWKYGNWGDEFHFLIENMFIYRNKKRYKDITKQREFIKKSRKLGISDDILWNYNYNTLNKYYAKKYEWFCNVIFIYLKDIYISPVKSVNYLWYEMSYISFYLCYLFILFNKLFADLENKRINNIIKNFNKQTNTKDYQKYKNYQIYDIF